MQTQDQQKSSTVGLHALLVTGGIFVALLAGAARHPADTLKYALLATLPGIIVYALHQVLGRTDPSSTRMFLHLYASGATWVLAAGVGVSAVVTLTGIRGELIAGTVEEAVKIAGTYWLAKRYLRGFNPANAALAGIALAGGFAFTENVLYFAISDRAGLLGQTFVARGMITPYAHPFFTALGMLFVGAGVNYVRNRERRRGIGFGILGYVLAASGHALFDLGASAGAVRTVLITFIGMILLYTLVLMAQSRRRRRLRELLSQHDALFTRPEIDLLCDLQYRHQVRDALSRTERADYDRWVNEAYTALDTTNDFEALTELSARLHGHRLRWDRTERQRLALEQEHTAVIAETAPQQLRHFIQLDNVLHDLSDTPQRDGYLDTDQRTRPTERPRTDESSQHVDASSQSPTERAGEERPESHSDNEDDDPYRIGE